MHSQPNTIRREIHGHRQSGINARRHRRAQLGSIGLFGFDLVAFLCGGQMGTVSRVIYTLVGLAGVWCITMLFRETEPIEGDAHA